MAEPGFGWDLGRFTGLGGTGHNLPGRYLKGSLQTLTISGSALTKGVQDPTPPPMFPGPPPPSRNSHTGTQRKAGCLATSAHEASGSPQEHCAGLLPHKL